MISGVDQEIVVQLNKILEHELSGVIRYTHYSFMVFGYSRIPIVDWLRKSAIETLDHAHRAGEIITHVGCYPSLGIGKMVESHQNEISDILRESLAYERAGVDMYNNLLRTVEKHKKTDRSSVLVMLEEYALELIYEEEQHVGDLDKMLRRPGTIESVLE